MSINGQCPGCGRKFQAPDKLAGKRVKCPKCAAMIEVGAAAAETDGWYLQTSDGDEDGPMPKAQLDALVAEGVLNCFGRVRHETWNDWEMAEKVYPELALAASTPSEASVFDAMDDDDGVPLAKLKSCPDCGKMVSRRAGQCPHCGSPMGETDPPIPVTPRKRSHLGMIVGGIAIVLLLGVAGSVGGVLWWINSRDVPVEEVAIVPEVPALPAPPDDAFATREEMEECIQEVATATAKEVDAMHKQVHMASSMIARTQETVDLMESLMESHLPESAREHAETVTPTEMAPYESQFEPFFEECSTYLREKVPFEGSGPDDVQRAAGAWARQKRTPLEEQLGDKINLGLGL